MSLFLAKNAQSDRRRQFWNRSAALLGGGLAVGSASFEVCEAALVFTSLDLVLDPDVDPITGRVDFNGDGKAEVGITVGTASVPDANGHHGMVHGGGLFGAQIAFSGPYPVAFQASDLITASLSFRTAIGTLALSSDGRLGSRGHWFAGFDGYLGARFSFNGDIFYGWLHAVWDPDLLTMTVDLAAYEDSGGAAHIVPQPDEPESFRVDFGEGSMPGRMEVHWPVLAGKTYELQRKLGIGEGWETIYVVAPYMDGEESFLDNEFEEKPPPQCFYRIKQNKSSLLLLALGIPRRRRKGEERG